MGVGSGVRSRSVGLDHIERSGRPAARNGVDQERTIVTRNQLEGQVKAANSKVFDPHLGKTVRGQHARNLRAKAVITEEDIADSGDEQFHGEGSAPSETGSTSSG